MEHQSATTRQHKRARVEFYINKIAGDVPHLMKVRDISASGMYVVKLLEPTSAASREFTVEMQLPGQNELIWAAVEVVREEGRTDVTGYGVRFCRLAEADRARIMRYVDGQKGELTSSVQRKN